jgi:CheY-like chemotaxis protein
MTEEVGAILVVDDDAEMRELVHDVLKDRGHQVTTAGSGQEAVTLLAEQDYAVVLTDLRMRMPGRVVGGDQASLSGHQGHSHDGLWVSGHRGRGHGGSAMTT